MTRELLNRQIKQLLDQVLLLGSMVEQATYNAINTLKTRDVKSARQVFDDDMSINEKRYAIENAIIITIATQQPMAHDLRTLAAIMEIITELERMGDYAKGIAKVTMRLGDADLVIPIREIEQMSELGVGMLHRALSAFVNEDAKTASKIPAEDDAVDALFNETYGILVSQMIADPHTIESTNLLLWVIHNLERLADRVTNICERTVFIATGELMDMDPSDEEDNE
ncbi:MAG: phosphate signaling complex protein PhoU [Leptolinea sp.]|jgi:phosphate transport system protein|nr:phosphate signaling complex protein PhoU [Leptolinea sp.]